MPSTFSLRMVTSVPASSVRLRVHFSYPLRGREQQGQRVLGDLVRISTCVATDDDTLVQTCERYVVDARENALKEFEPGHLLKALLGQFPGPGKHEEDVDCGQNSC